MLDAVPGTEYSTDMSSNLWVHYHSRLISYIILNMSPSLEILHLLPSMQISWNSCSVIWKYKYLKIFNLLFKHFPYFPEIKPDYNGWNCCPCSPLKRRFIFFSCLTCVRKKVWHFPPSSLLRLAKHFFSFKKIPISPMISDFFFTLLADLYLLFHFLNILTHDFPSSSLFLPTFLTLPH